MALTGIGIPIATLEGFAAPAQSHLGERVTVQYSQEALDDFGSGVIWPIAEKKHNDGKFKTVGETKVVRITMADCQKWMDSDV